MKTSSYKDDSTNSLRLNWRVVWYSVLIWIMVIIIGGFVVLPWFYLILPIALFWATIFYFKKGDKTFKRGLWVSLIWFFIGTALDFFEIIGPYYMNAELYFSDARNWLKYPLILLIPVIYSLVLETVSFRKSSKKIPSNLSPQA